MKVFFDGDCRKLRQEVGKDFVDWNGICPDCGGFAWIEGPRGGLNQNITCSWPTCGAKLNVLDYRGILLAQRI